MSFPYTSAQARYARLRFTPTYILVGIYRLATDPNLFVPIWSRLRHGVQRGGVLGIIWAILTFKLQRAFVRLFLKNSSRVTGLSEDTILGYKIPLDITTYATVVLISSQITILLHFFLARSIRMARERAWEQTLKSRGKAPEFWGPYVEEWQVPPQVNESRKLWKKLVSKGLVRYLIIRVLLAPLHLYPFVGILLTSSVKAVDMARYLHKPYFSAKKMTPHQTAVFMAERKWDYLAFGFVAAFLEDIPVIGLGFSISNRIGAAMWAHDLEKKQHSFASGELQHIPPSSPRVLFGKTHSPSIQL